MAPLSVGTASIQPPLGELERALITEYLVQRGYDDCRIAELGEVERRRLLKEAALYASGRLTEVEARSHLLSELHEGGTGGSSSSDR